MKIARFNSKAFSFPPSRIPAFPCQVQLKGDEKEPVLSARNTQTKHFRSFRRGRYALAEAYRLAGLKRHTSLLAPAYHCLTMLDGAVSLGADILLYPLRPDLSVELDELDRIVRDSSTPVRAMLATHFFGIVQNFENVKQWCDARDIVLVEDCSHVLFTEDFQTKGTGLFGTYVVSSPYKFVATQDGGLLYASESNLLKDVNTIHPGVIEELRGLKHVIENHWASRKMRIDVDEIDVELPCIPDTQGPPRESEVVQYDRPSYSFSEANIHKSALRSSEWLVRHAPVIEIACQRRKNFQRWAEAVAGLSNCRALYRDLADECVPYMFPLYLDYPDLHFNLLKQFGVPLCRWNSLVISDCKVSAQYRLHLIQLPCYQSLSDQQMEWMISAVSKVMVQPVGEAR